MKKMRQDGGRDVLSHKIVFGSLDAYSDGTLQDSERARVEAHLQTCAECGESLRQINRLDLLLNDLPSTPSVPFSRFWSTLEERLPNHEPKKLPFFRPARLAASLALALLASLVGVVALASDGVMPDSPLYSVKHLRQNVQIRLAGARERPRLELSLGKQRLQEAVVMVKRNRHDLALASLRDFHALLVDAAPRLENAPVSRSDTAALASTVDELKTELGAVSDANVAQEGTAAADVAAVDSAVRQELNAVGQVDAGLDESGPPVVESPSPSPEPPSPEASPSALPSEQPSPEAAPSAAPSEPAPADVLSPPPA